MTSTCSETSSSRHSRVLQLPNWGSMDWRNWTIAGVGLTFFIWKWQLILTVAVVFIAFICGISVRLHKNYATEPLNEKKARRVHLVYTPIAADSNPADDGAPEFQNGQNFRQKLDLRVTGSALIDETIQEMTDIILRDYVHAWYDSLTEDDEFIHELRATVQVVLVTLSSRVKEVDWIPYITTVLVDDTASHLRLFRQSQVKIRESCNADLVSTFFDFEAAMERTLCRDMVSLDDSHLHDYIQGFCEGVLYFLLPQNVCSSLGFMAQDLLVNHVLSPAIKMFSDPDFMNQLIIWMCREFVVTPDIFMSVVRSCDNMDEICTLQDFFDAEVSSLLALQKSLTKLNSAEESEGRNLKQHLRCLSYVVKCVEEQLSLLKEGNPKHWMMDDESDEWQHYTIPAGVKALTLEEVLRNSVALSYFLDYMNTVGGNNYLLLYLNADAWRVSGEVQLSEIEASSRTATGTSKSQVLEKSNQAMLDCMREAALNIYDQFLSEKVTHKIQIPEPIVKRLYVHLKTEKISSGLFDEVQAALLDTMQTTEKFFPGFSHSKLYIKSLMELDLIKAETTSSHSISSASDDEEDMEMPAPGDEASCKPGQRLQGQEEDLPDFQICYECLKLRKQVSGARPEDVLSFERELWSRKYRLKAEIIESALTVQRGKTFGIYVVLVTKEDNCEGTWKERTWHIYRRYSDFYDFHMWIKSKWMKLSKIEFPGKQTFGKTDRAFLEKRMAALNKYLACVLQMTTEQCFGASLQDSVLHFLEPGSYSVQRRLFSDRIDNIVLPLRQTVKSVTEVVRTMPDTFLSTMDGLSKMFVSKESEFIEGIKVGAAIDNEVDSNIPLRIILLFFDEVFNLKSRHQWLRRRIVVMIREIIKTMMGDNLNKRIIDNVAFHTSPVQVAWYLHNLEHTLWPGGEKLNLLSHRDQVMKDRTRIAAKMSLLSAMSDELKHLIGSDTTRRGLRTVFELCQNRVLNQRLVIVLMEGIVKTLYQDKPFQDLIQRLHFRSHRISKRRPFLIPANFAAVSTSSLSPRSSRKRAS